LGLDRGDDDGLGAAAERLLEEPRELRLAVGHVHVPLHQRRDHASEGEERLVDLARLLLAVALPPIMPMLATDPSGLDSIQLDLLQTVPHGAGQHI